MKKLYLTIAIATVMLGLTLGNASATTISADNATGSVKGMTYKVYIQAGQDQAFATVSFAKTGLMSVAGWNGFGLYVASGPMFAGIFYGIDVATIPAFKGNVVMLLVGYAATINTVAGYGYLWEEHTGDYFYKDFPFLFTGAF
jgi:hypothetical protein